MKVKLALLFGCSIIILSTAAQTGKTATDKWLQHQDTTFNFTINYPANWEFKLPGTNTRFFITSFNENDSDSFRDNINCIARKLDQQHFKIASAEAAIKQSLKEKLNNYNLVKSHYITWNNTDALQLMYTCTKDESEKVYEIQIFQQIAVVKGTIYTLTYTAEKGSYKKYIDVVNKVYRSFKIN